MQNKANSLILPLPHDCASQPGRKSPALPCVSRLSKSPRPAAGRPGPILLFAAAGGGAGPSGVAGALRRARGRHGGPLPPRCVPSCPSLSLSCSPPPPAVRLVCLLYNYRKLSRCCLGCASSLFLLPAALRLPPPGPRAALRRRRSRCLRCRGGSPRRRPRPRGALWLMLSAAGGLELPLDFSTVVGAVSEASTAEMIEWSGGPSCPSSARRR